MKTDAGARSSPGTDAPATWWLALGGPNALTSWSWIVTTVTAVVLAVAVEAPAYDYRPWPRVVLVVCAQLCILPLFVLGRAVLLASKRSRPLLGMALFIALGCARGIAMFLLAPMIEPLGVDFLGYQVALNVTYALLSLPFIAIVVDSVRRHRDLRTTVIAERLRWRNALDQAEAQFTQEYDRYRALVELEITEKIVHLKDDLESLAREAAGSGAVSGAHELRRLSAEVVRPLSHELILEPASARLAPIDFVEVPPRLGLREILREAPRRPFAGHWGVCAVMVLLGLVGLSTFGSRPLLAVNLAWNVLLNGVVPWAIGPGIRRLWGRMPLWGAWAASLALWVVIAVTGIAGTALIMDAFTGTGVLFWGAAVAYVVLSAGVVVGLAGFRRQQDLDRELGHILQQQEAVASRLMRRLEHERRELGGVLHGSVQSSLTRAALALERWGQTMDAAGLPAVMAEVRQALNTALHAFDPVRASDLGLATVVHERLLLWGSAVDCRAVVSREADEGSDASVAARAGDIIGEGVTNAVRHGHADAVMVDCEMEEDCLVIQVRDNGAGPRGPRAEGLGLGQLTHAGLAWTLERDGDETVLTVRIPVAG